MDVNVTGVLLCCQVIGGAMAEAGRGSIVNVCSIYGLVSPDQRIYEYRAEGGGLLQAGGVLGVEVGAAEPDAISRDLLGAAGVRVNTVTFAGVFNNQDARFLEGYCARVPLGRMAREDEYNGAVVFLCSDASSYMTGANLVMDGGWTAW